MDAAIKKAISLAKKTGDRIIIVDSSCPSDSFVIMPFEQYERLSLNVSQKDKLLENVKNLTDQDLIDKINRDIAVWKESQEMERSMRDLGAGLDDYEEKQEDWQEDENLYYYDEERRVQPESDSGGKDNNEEPYNNQNNQFDIRQREEENKPKNQWSIPPSVKKQAEEVLEDDLF
jgi:hypothetical protein